MHLQVTYRSIWLIAYPIIAGLVAETLMNVIDTAFLGRVGEVALGAGAIGGLFYFALIVLGVGLGIGAQILIGRRNGEEKYNEIGLIIHQLWIFLAGIGIAIFAFLYFFGENVLSGLIASEAISDASTTYINIRAWGIFFSFINISFKAFYIGTLQTRILTVSTSIQAGINIILDYFFIFGAGNIPPMGVAGAALATVIAEFITCVFFIIYTRFYTTHKQFALFKKIRFQFVIFKQLFKIASPVMLQHFISFGAWFLFFVIIEKLGQQALAISNIARSLYMLLLVPLWGFASAANSMVSNLIGQHQSNKVMQLLYKVIVLSLSITLIMDVSIVFFPEAMLAIYSDDANLIANAVPVMHVIAVALVLFAVAITFFSGLSGTGKTTIALIFEICIISLYFGTAYILAVPMQQSLQKVWLVEPMYFFLIGLCSFIYLKSERWKKLKI